MKMQKEFIVGRDRDTVAAALGDDATLETLFPDTTVERIDEGTRETRTPYPGPGRARDIRFRFHSQPGGDILFEKVCDGNIWRSLRGAMRSETIDERSTRVVLEMDGRTRALVPELTIRIPMREQIEQMAKALQARIEDT